MGQMLVNVTSLTSFHKGLLHWRVHIHGQDAFVAIVSITLRTVFSICA